MASKRRVTTLLEEQISETPGSDYKVSTKHQRRSVGWNALRKRVRDALQQLRILIFVHIEDPQKCLETRLTAVFRGKTLAWKAFQQLRYTTQSSLQDRLLELNMCTSDGILETLASLLANVLLGHVNEYRPLEARMSSHRQQLLERVLSSRVRNACDSFCPQQALPGFQSWFRIQTQPSMEEALTLQDIHIFKQTRTWAVDESIYNQKCAAFDQKRQRSESIAELNAWRRILTTENDTEEELDSITSDLKEIQDEEKLMLMRARKYRLYPTSEQQKRLRNFMGTCRWTYNQAVAHFRKTNEFRARSLRILYVNRTTTTTRVYPPGMGPPPEWVYDTPYQLRDNALRTFEANVKSAFTNLQNGNTERFRMNFKSRKDSRYFTICEDGATAKIDYIESEKRAELSIGKLKRIPIRCDPGLKITNQIKIINTNGNWYVVIPQFVRPRTISNRGGMIALDPGLKAFITGVDLGGNVVHIGRGNQAHLDRFRTRIADAQQRMSMIKNVRGHRSGKQWKILAKAKREFECATAKKTNSVRELHHQTCAFLTNRYDIILLPMFSTKQMVKKSKARNHRYNDMLLSLKHFQFRERLRAKCEVTGKSLVVCSEMYTSQTCGRCSTLNLKLGNKDVFECPHCGHVAGRDVNAAFNILRFVCGGSLAVHAVHR